MGGGQAAAHLHIGLGIGYVVALILPDGRGLTIWLTWRCGRGARQRRHNRSRICAPVDAYRLAAAGGEAGD